MVEVADLMRGFDERTGISRGRAAPAVPAAAQTRYLWTDAFAVCNFIGLAATSGDHSHTDAALRLVEDVHRVLGRYRPDDTRSGWLSGRGQEVGGSHSHPTWGGLRIGKRLPERRPEDPVDERLEWERDGQYFHYLTKWMHALDQVARSTRQPQFNVWARELADVAHQAFSYGSPQRDGRRMVWKMSTDLSRPLVSSMGQHDPIEGLVTCTQLQLTAASLAGVAHGGGGGGDGGGAASGSSAGPAGPDLTAAIADFALMIEDRDWSAVDDDALGLGSLLADAGRVAQLHCQGAFADGDLLDSMLAAALAGLTRYARENDLKAPASQRLAFRELGLAIGLHAVELMLESQGTRPSAGIAALVPFLGLGSTIESFWLDSENQKSPAWTDHRDISEVMLATSLAPAGFLRLIPIA